jgi:hypothetical protein
MVLFTAAHENGQKGRWLQGNSRAGVNGKRINLSMYPANDPLFHCIQHVSRAMVSKALASN